MPYELGTIWNVTSKYIYNTLDKNIGIGTTTPICELDVYCNIAENGIKLEDKYQLKPEHNKKYDLIVREDLDEDHQHLIIWYKFNKDDFTSNFTSNNYNTDTEYRRLIIEGTGTISNLQKEYYVGTGSAEINDELYYKIEMTTNKFSSAQYTFCFWLFLNEECENDRYILNLKDTASDLHTSIFHFKYNTDKLIIYKNYQTNIEYHYTLHKKKWHHISIIINNIIEPIILINGIKLTNYTPTANNIYLRDGVEKQNSADIYLGYTNNSTINGYIDDFRIYKTNLQINYIQNNIIGKITKITPGNISANGNYGIDIVNYSNIVNIGGTGPNDNVNLRVFGDLTVDGDLSISNLNINTSTFNTLTVNSNLTVSNDVNIEKDLTVNKTITENQRTLAQKYASISQIDKHTDVIISKMTDKDDVEALYSNMPEFFQSNLILAYDFDFNIDDIDNPDDFFSNNVLKLNTNTDSIYSTFSEYSIVPNRSKNFPIDYYGTKYVKGNSSLHCGSNIFNSGGIDYYSFTTLDTNQAYFSSSKSYTIAFWIRFNEIDRNQHIFNFGVPANSATTEKSINLSLNSSNNLNIDIINEGAFEISNIINTKFKKDEWYHIVLILKNGIDINSIPTDINTNSNLLIQYFANLGYTNHTSSSSTYFDFRTQANKATIFTYVNGIEVDMKLYDTDVSIFGNTPTTFINYFGIYDSSTTDYLNGYIDDFKMYETVVPINYINENIIGDALIIKPGLLSAIGNYGINIKNFTNTVSIGEYNNDVDLHIYGLLKIEETKLTISNCDIDVIGDTLTTSNFNILETLDVSNITVSNIEIYDLISGPDFHLGSSNFISDIKIDHLSNINLNSSNITANTITVNNELILNTAILSNIKIYGINIDDTFSISNSDIKIRSNLIIGDNSSNVRRYDLDLGSVNIASGVLDTLSNFTLYNAAYPHPSQYALTTITDTDDIQVFDKSIIFYGNTDQQHYDIHFKNNYIRDEHCNIINEINKSYSGGVDRSRTRIKLDVGNISLQNGFIQLIHQDILEDNLKLATLSTLKIEENQISINSNHNTTILNDSLMLSNNENYCNCLLTNSNFMFNNGNGFTDAETLKINTIEITEKIEIKEINTTNSNSNTISINTSNADNPYGKIQGFLCSNSKIDIQNEIKTDSNIICEELHTSNINVSNITCKYKIGFTPDSTSNTTITRERIEVNTLQIYGSIILGHQASSGNDNSIDGDFGSLSIKTINTTNPYSNALSIDTFYATNLGKIRGLLSSNSKINIDDEIRTNSNIYCIDLESSNIYVIDLYSSNINTSNITVEDKLNVYNIIAISIDVSNLKSSNINTTNITVEDELNVHNIIASNIKVSNLESSNINVSNITVKDELNVYNIIASNIEVSNLESSNIYVSNLKSSNINVIDLYSSNINTSNINTTNITVEDELNVHNIIASNIKVSNLESSNINVSNITVKDELNVYNIIASNIDCSDTIESFNIISSNVTVNNTLSVNDIAVSDTIRAVNIRGYTTEHCEILGILSSNSYIDINGEIKTTSNIYASNIITDTLEICNILNNNSDSGYFIISSNSGILINNIKTTSLADYSIDTLVDGSLGKIRGKLADDSEIHIDGRIETTSNISGNILEINTIIGSTGSTGININNDINFNCNITNDVTIDDKKFQIITHIPGIAEPSSQIELIGNRIKSFGDIEADRHIYMEFDYNGLRRVEDGNTCNIISYDEGINGIVLKCKKLEVENFDPGDGSQFKFPNIISFSRNTTASIPNVYIGYNTDNINIDTDKDVLYIDTDTGNDTGNDKRLNVGNILVRNNIEISHNRDAADSKLLKITTMETVESSRTAQYAFFFNQNDDEMLTIDLDSGSIGINTRPLASDDQIKLFVNGGIKSSGDIIGFANVSDKRFKTNIRSFDINDIEIVNKLNPVKFKWKEDLFNSNMANKNDIGFIAQEVKLLIPEAVSTFKIEMDDIDYNYIKYERMIPYLINNIKYLNNKIVELENKLNGI